jgi:PhzF family phenazine biosynthesis protein
MQLPLYQVDAFASAPFTGNPAAVVLLTEWLSDDTLQAIAQENNLSETAYLLPAAGGPADYELRWFTPVNEVDLCGHATLASAQVVLGHVAPQKTQVTFQTKSGPLRVTREGLELSMALPTREAARVPVTEALCAALGARPLEAWQAVDLMAVFDTEAEVRALSPRFEALSALPPSGVMVTAPGSACDFVSRFFAPREGVPEDPVTGSAHCTLVPYWAKRLGKADLHARQVSRRGGELRCRLLEGQVLLTGRAVTYLVGTITV